MNNYIEVDIHVKADEEKEILMAELISIGFEAFEEEEGKLKAFVSDTSFNQDVLNTVTHLRGHHFDIHHIDEKNWNEEWEKNFEPVVIGDFCSVRADFHPKNPNTDYEIVITPKMSFGTGHHATTHMMLELMREIDFNGKSVFDFGTGTGILAIMSEMLGASEITAIDVDEWSIRNARENMDRNNCTKARLVQTDNIPTDKSFKIILANINRNVILANMEGMCKILEEGGEILLSGLMEEDYEIVLAKAVDQGLRLQKKGEKSGWIALRFLLHS